MEVPRSLWLVARHNHTLKHCYFRAAKLYTDMAEAEENLKEVTEVRGVGRGERGGWYM